MRYERTVGSSLHEYLVPFPCLWITSGLAWISIEIKGRSSFRPFFYIILLEGGILNQIDRSFLLTGRWQIRRMSIRSYGERRDEQMEIQFDSISEPKWKGRERERGREKQLWPWFEFSSDPIYSGWSRPEISIVIRYQPFRRFSMLPVFL